MTSTVATNSHRAATLPESPDEAPLPGPTTGHWTPSALVPIAGPGWQVGARIQIRPVPSLRPLKTYVPRGVPLVVNDSRLAG
jgi:hypothetical protein